jgi:hypothetical protein
MTRALAASFGGSTTVSLGAAGLAASPAGKSFSQEKRVVLTGAPSVLGAAGATVAMVGPSGEEVEDQGLFRPSQATRRKEAERRSRERCMAGRKVPASFPAEWESTTNAPGTSQNPMETTVRLAERGREGLSQMSYE